MDVKLFDRDVGVTEHRSSFQAANNAEFFEKNWNENKKYFKIIQLIVSVGFVAYTLKYILNSFRYITE